MKKYKYQFDVIFGKNDPYYPSEAEDTYIGVETSLIAGLKGLEMLLNGGDYIVTGVTLLEIIEDEEHLKVVSHD